MSNILIVDDDAGVGWAFGKMIEEMGHRPLCVPTGEAAIESFRNDKPDLIIMDVKLPGMDGLTALREIRKLSTDVPVIVITAHGTLETALQAIDELGAEYLAKPVNLAEAEVAVKRGLGKVKSSREISELQREIAGKYSVLSLVGKNPTMQEVFKTIATICKSDANVLIAGESGTGKELVARSIHYNSNRSGAPFEPINCAAIPDPLLESELFGHEKGAYTGAVGAKVGRLEHADGGTLFLDEIGEMPLSSQIKLLRFIEDRRITRLGSNTAIDLSVRLIAATNQDLELLVKEGRFREDLYYRLNVVRVTLPPLRRRKDDIPLLIAHFLEQAGTAGGVTDDAKKILEQYPWPGNVRELRNAVEHGCVLARGKPIGVDHLPEMIVSPVFRSTGEEHKKIRDILIGLISSGAVKDGDLHRGVEERWEKELLQIALAKVGGNQVKASELLGINRLTLRKKMQQYNISSSPE